MLSWVAVNIGTIAVALAVAAVVAVVLIVLLRDKKQGKTSCSHGCANCAMHDQCHGAKQ